MYLDVIHSKFKPSNAGVKLKIEVDNLCPLCLEKSKPDLSVVSELEEHSDMFFIVFQCQHCYSYYLVEYRILEDLYDSVMGAFETDLIPYTRKINISDDIPQEIDSISDQFRNIYLEAKSAEAYELSEIAGVGYRKAIEFLVKDYLINFKNLGNGIKKMPLNQCINKIQNPQIEPLIRASTWLGNDETHYERIHSDKNIEDMKKFIHSAVLLIAAELSVENAIKFLEQE